MILFLSINLISANEINDNDLNSIDSSNLIGIDSVDDTDSLSSSLNEEDLNEGDIKSDNADSNVLSEIEQNSANVQNSEQDSVNVQNSEAKVLNTNNSESNLADTQSKESTHITVQKTSVLRGTTLYIYLKDSKGNPIAGKQLTLTINKEKYTKTTDKNGAVPLPFKILLGDYTLKVHFNGDSNYSAKTTSFLLHIYQLKTKVTVSKESVARGRYLYAYLKDSSGNPLSGKKITFKFRGNNYVKTTNKKGRASLKISPVAGKYPINIVFSGSTSYKKSNKKFTLKVYRPATKITVASKSVIRGKCLYAYLKDSAGNALKSKPVTIRFDGVNFHRTTNKNGRVALKIKTKLGTFSTKISFAGSGYYKASSKSLKVKSYVAKTKITASSSVVRGKYFYVYLKDSSNKAVSSQKVKITFNGKKYTRTTNKNGRAALLITAAAKSYSVKINYAGSNSYKSSSKSMTLQVKNNVTAKIIAKSGTFLGEYSIRLTDLNGNPLIGETVKFLASTHNKSAGSLKKITQKTIIIDTDVIFTEARDKKFMNDLATALRAKGFKVIIGGRGANAHNDDVQGKYSNAVVLCLFGGADAGMFYSMGGTWYQTLLKKYNNRVVLGFLDPPNVVNLATCTWLKRAHDDDYSPASFTGLAYPGTFLNQHGMDYIYGKSATEMANNFVKYAVNGLSIGLGNTLPSVVNTYSIKTNSEGFATISGLTSGTYNIQVSYSNPSKGYAADTVTVKVEIK